ncbi:MAG: ankyrin repeat domain-containing protein [Pseudomonadota bacterium]
MRHLLSHFGSRFVKRCGLALALIAVAAGPARAATDEVALFRAAQVDNGGAVQQLLAKGLDPNVKEPLAGETALIIAVRDDAQRVVKVLLAHPAIDLEAAASNGNTALMMAAYKQNRVAVDALLARGARIDRAGWTPLHYAAASGNAEITRLFIAKGARLDAASPTRITPLMIAAREGKDNTVALLLAAGADASLKSAHGWTAAQFAMSAERKDIADLIAAHLKGAPPA